MIKTQNSLFIKLTLIYSLFSCTCYKIYAQNTSQFGPTVQAQKLVIHSQNNKKKSYTITAEILNQQFYDTTANIDYKNVGICFGAKVNPLQISETIPAKTINQLSTWGNSNKFNCLKGNDDMPSLDPDSIIGFSIYTSAYPLQQINKPINGRYYYGDVKISFSKPLTNPVILVSGLGAQFCPSAVCHGFTTDIEIQNDASTQLQKIDGNKELSVVHNKIENNAKHFGSQCNTGAACGAVKVIGKNIKQLKLSLFIKGDNVGTSWGSQSAVVGDAFVIALYSQDFKFQ